MFRPELSAQALYEMLRDAPAVRTLNVTDRNLVLMDYVNTEPENTPWIGVYLGRTDLTPYTMGSRTGGANTLRATVQFRVVIQMAGMNEAGYDIAARLGELTSAVLDTIWADTTLKGTVKLVTKTEMQLNYYGDSTKEAATIEFPMVDITVTAEVRT